MKDFLNADFKDIIAEIKEMEDIGMIWLIILMVIFFIIDILHFIYKFNYPENFRVFYVVLFTIISTHFVNKTAKRIRLEKEKIKQDEQATRLIKTFLVFCAPLLEELNGTEQMILSDIARSFTNFTVIKSGLLNNKQLEITLKNLILKLKSVGLELKISNTYPNLLVEVDEMTKKILKYYYNIK